MCSKYYCLLKNKKLFSKNFFFFGWEFSKRFGTHLQIQLNVKKSKKLIILNYYTQQIHWLLQEIFTITKLSKHSNWSWNIYLSSSLAWGWLKFFPSIKIYSIVLSKKHKSNKNNNSPQFPKTSPFHKSK